MGKRGHCFTLLPKRGGTAILIRMNDEPCLSLLEARPVHNDWPAAYHELRVRLKLDKLAAEKWVGIRYSWDGWASADWLEASYVGPLPETGGRAELWEACLLVPLDRRTIDFAISCRMAGRVWWDNNHGQNYRALIPPSADQR
jgi:hypothetical protein